MSSENNKWYMLTLVGRDQIGIVARITGLLYATGGMLGEASMLRLGGNFTIMLMVRCAHSLAEMHALLAPVADEMGLHIHIDAIVGELHHHQVPDVEIHVHGADRAGIVAQITAALAQAGCTIVSLESDVGGSSAKPFYLMHIEGVATQGMARLQDALTELADKHQDDLEIRMNPIDTAIL
jgi:glycine cleavage system transcriptional repressor